MIQIKTRIINNTVTFYDSSTGQPIKNISAVSFQDSPNVVYTITTKDGAWWVRVSSRGMALMKLEDVIDKLGLVVYKVS